MESDAESGKKFLCGRTSHARLVHSTRERGREERRSHDKFPSYERKIGRGKEKRGDGKTAKIFSHSCAHSGPCDERRERRGGK